MNIWLIMMTELKHVIRNRTFLVMMILFPLILILILGTALSGGFNHAAPVKEIRIGYHCDESPSQLTQAFQDFAGKSGSQGTRFREMKRLSRGITGIQKGEEDCFVRVATRGLQIYQNERSPFRAGLATAVLYGFTRRYQAIAAIAKIKPEAAIRISRQEFPARSGWITERSVSGARKPRAIDYYAVTMLTLIIMYSMQTSSYAIRREILARTANRLLCCPIGNQEILIGKMGGSLCSALLCVGIVVAVSKYLFRAYWGAHPAIVALLLATEVIMATSAGIGLAFLIRNQIALNGFINLLIPVVVFLGGGYYPVDSFGGLFLRCADLSPLRWINKAMFQVIYNHDFQTVLPAVLINIGIAAAFVAVASRAARKEMFLR